MRTGFSLHHRIEGGKNGVACLTRANVATTIPALSHLEGTRMLRLADRNLSWPLDDRVLVWLAGHWHEDVTNYHAKKAGSMSDRFMPHQLSHLDEHYLQVLRDRLRAIGILA